MQTILPPSKYEILRIIFFTAKVKQSKNDSDLQKPLQIAKEKFNKKTFLISPSKTVQKDLAKYSTFVQRIKENDIQSSQFPNTVSNKPLIRKPNSWT